MSGVRFDVENSGEEYRHIDQADSVFDLIHDFRVVVPLPESDSFPGIPQPIPAEIDTAIAALIKINSSLTSLLYDAPASNDDARKAVPPSSTTQFVNTALTIAQQSVETVDPVEPASSNPSAAAPAPSSTIQMEGSVEKSAQQEDSDQNVPPRSKQPRRRNGRFTRWPSQVAVVPVVAPESTSVPAVAAVPTTTLQANNLPTFLPYKSIPYKGTKRRPGQTEQMGILLPVTGGSEIAPASQVVAQATPAPASQAIAQSSSTPVGQTSSIFKPYKGKKRRPQTTQMGVLRGLAPVKNEEAGVAGIIPPLTSMKPTFLL